jgi:hypothetical protein
MASQVVRRSGRAMALDVRRRCAHDDLDLAEWARGPARVCKPADADGDVDAGIDQVDHGVVYE